MERELMKKQSSYATNGSRNLHSFKCCRESIGKQSKENNTNDLLTRLNLFKCNYCSYRTRFYFNSNKHMQLHRRPKNYKFICHLQSPEKYRCQLCNFQSHLKIFMTKHFNAVHKEEEAWLYQVKYTQNLSSKNKHHEEQTKHNKIKSFECRRCFYTAKEKERVQYHVRLTHTKRYQCDNCSYSTDDKKSLQNHVRRYHTPPVLQISTPCSYTAKRTSSLQEHLVGQHAALLELEKLKYFQCASCSYKDAQEENLILHMILEHPSLEKYNWLKCESCSYETTVKASLHHHVLSRHNMQIS